MHISEIGSQYSDEAFDDDFDDVSSISSADKVSICSEGAKKSEHKHFVKGHRRNRSCDIKTILGNTPVRTVSIDDGYSSTSKTSDSTPESLQLPSPLPNSVSTPMGLCSLPPASSQTQSQSIPIPDAFVQPELSSQITESSQPEQITQRQQATDIPTSSTSQSNLAEKQFESTKPSGPSQDIPSPMRRSSTVAEFGDVATTTVIKRVSSVGSDMSKLQLGGTKDKHKQGPLQMNGLLPLSLPTSTDGDNTRRKSASSKLKVAGALPLLDFATITKDRTLTF